MDKPTLASGVSVVLCCYNSAGRLMPTLTALARQKVDSSLNWEIILVDNASTDDTGIICTEIWDSILNKPDITFKVVYEVRRGQAFARKKGISSASFRYVLFCDDDNWLGKDYIQEACRILDSDSRIAACGGLGFPVFETEKPYWFDQYQEAFAVGSQEITTYKGKILNLYGAGLAINTQALRKLEKNGFEPILPGRVGTALSSSDDTELTYALALAGYQLHFESKMTFQHFLPDGRLRYAYLKNLFVSFGKDGPVRNIYYAVTTNRFPHIFIKYWSLHLLLSSFRLVKYLILPPKPGARDIYLAWNKSYIRELFALKKNYRTIFSRIESIKQVNACLDPSRVSYPVLQ